MSIKKQQGFTLIELLLYVGVSAAVFFVVIMASGTAFDAQIKQESINEVERQGEVMVRLISDLVRQADVISVPARTETGARLGLTIDGSVYDISVFEDVLLIQVDGGESEPLHNDVVAISAFTVENRASVDALHDLIRFSFTLSRDSESLRSAFSYQSDFVGVASPRS